MDILRERYYTPSGRVPTIGTVCIVVAGAAAAAVLSFVYALLDYYNPFIYFTCIGAVALGAAVGFVVNVAAQAGKVRSRLVRRLAAVGMASLAVVFAWMWFIWIASGYQVFLLDFAGLWKVVQFFAENGLWELKGSKPTGWVLYAVWLTEAVLIIGFGASTSLSGETPFCEACDGWTQAGNELVHLALTDPSSLKTDLEDERYDVLDTLRRGEIDVNNRLDVKWHTCPRCTDANYLSIAQVTVTTNSKGEQETKTNEIVQHLIVPASLIEQLKTPIESASDTAAQASAGSAPAPLPPTTPLQSETENPDA